MWVMQRYHITGVGSLPKENALEEVLLVGRTFSIFMQKSIGADGMDKLQETALAYQSIMQTQYYFDILKLSICWKKAIKQMLFTFF